MMFSMSVMLRSSGFLESLSTSSKNCPAFVAFIVRFFAISSNFDEISSFVSFDGEDEDVDSEGAAVVEALDGSGVDEVLDGDFDAVLLKTVVNGVDVDETVDEAFSVVVSVVNVEESVKSIKMADVTPV